MTEPEPEPEHDSDLVKVASQRLQMRGKEIHLVSPFCGKSFCFDRWRTSVRRLPLSKVHATLYDNSNSPRFHRRIQCFAEKELSSFTIVKDSNKQQSIESTVDYEPIIKRCDAVYEEIYTRFNQPKLPFTINHEDDIRAPKGSFEKLMSVLSQNSDVGTVIGRCRDRRSVTRGAEPQSISVNFVLKRRIGGDEEEDVDVEWVPERKWGTELIGAGHMGFWLTRTEAIDICGFKSIPDYKILGQDIQWGIRLGKAGYRFVIDWSVELDHFYQKDGKVASC